MFRSLKPGIFSAVEGNAFKKFANPSVGRGQTVYPKTSGDQERIGVRWDYDGEVEKDGEAYHKFQLQPNAGKVPSAIKDWRNANGGTHAVMATAFVKKDASRDEVKEALLDAAETVEGV